MVEKLTHELQKISEQLMKSGPLITQYAEQDLIKIISHWHRLLKKQRMLIDLPDKKILVVGDIHGDYYHLRKAFHLFDEDIADYIIINGDLIDRGPEMIECLEYMVSRQIRDPEHIFYIRGNHELKSVNSSYGFRGYCTSIYGSRIYDKFAQGFQNLPLAAKVGSWGFICHGGIPNENIFFHLMRLELKENEPSSGPYYQLMWNDPDENIEGFQKSERGLNCYRFGNNQFEKFMRFHDLSLFIRAHQPFPEGYRWFFDKKLLSLFSSKAGPYSHITPHVALLENNEVELIDLEQVKFDELD